MKKTIDIERYQYMYHRFIETRRSAVLSFVDQHGKPFSSTTPFVKKDDKLYVYISRAAEHYQLMENSDQTDIILLADEADTKNAFARERVRFACQPKKLGNNNNEDIFALFDRNFGKSTMNLLKGLDFSLFELTPMTGRYVVGFGLAFDVTIDGSIFNHVVIDKESI